MINAWSLAYDVLNGTLDEHFPIMTDDKNKITPQESDEYDPIITVGSGNTASVFTTDFCVDPFENVEFTVDTSHYDTLNITLPDGCHDIDHDPWIYESPDGGATVTRRKSGSLDKEVVQGNYFNTSNRKYNEDESIQALKDYISTTYGGHYTSDNNNVQTLDLIESVGDAESFCRSNAIKYLSRYDKKGQAKRDILKALHYSLLLYHFSGQNNETSTSGYETF
tara:strand:- start:697 stop:1365 length:669 start_codon:yes stop_codon:yes gene_type:complete